MKNSTHVIVICSVILLLFTISNQNNCVADVAYYKITKDGRIYIFTSAARKADFEKSGELGKGIIKIGYGPQGETVVFGSDDAVLEYESHRSRRLLDRMSKGTYEEFRKDGRIYVFTSATRKADFEKSGELGKGIIKIGYGPQGETVIFDSDEAVGEFDKR